MLEASEAPAALEKVSISPEPLYRLLFGRPMTHLLYAAHDLGVFRALSERPQSLPELCDLLHLPSHSAEMLLNTCVALGLLKKQGAHYENTALSQQYLVDGAPLYLGGLLEHFRHQVFPAWDRLKEAIQEDGPQMQAEGVRQTIDVFQATQRLDKDTELFIAAMHNLSVSDGVLLSEAFDFSRFSRLLDVGGGSGALSLAVASRFPGLEATVLDRPQVCAIADRYIQEAGLSSRVKTFPSDAFTGVWPEGVDIILLSLFVHAFGLKRSAPVLKRCFESLPPGGCVLIYEPVLAPNRTEPLTTLLSSLNMLVCTPSGGDVTAEDYRLWLQDQGFESVFYRPVPTIRHLIGAFKPL